MTPVPVISAYFAYGSNMNPARVAERGLRVLRLEAARLRDCALGFGKQSKDHIGVGHAHIDRAPGDVVEGVLYWLAGVDEIFKMDRFEHTPFNYSRDAVTVETASGHVAAWTYFANPAVRARGLRPARAYLAHLLAGQAYLSPRYYARLAAWPVAD
jgi:hypothetical protein